MANVCALLILSRKLCSKSHQRDGNVFPRAKQQLEIWKPALVQDAEFNLRIGFNVHIVVSAVVASVTIVTQGCYILHSVQIKQNVGLSEWTLVPTCGNWWLTVGLLTGRNYELSLSYVPLKVLLLGLLVVLSSMARWTSWENLWAFCHPAESRMIYSGSNYDFFGVPDPGFNSGSGLNYSTGISMTLNHGNGTLNWIFWTIQAAKK